MKDKTNLGKIVDGLIASRPKSLDVPKDYRGRESPDRSMRVMQNLVKNYFWVINSRTYRDYYSDQVQSSTQELVLIDREIVAEDNNVVLLTLAAADRVDLPKWQPGCHLDFHLPSGRQRQYSLCGDPDNRGVYQVAVRKIPEGGGGSLEMHSLQIGVSLSIRGPRNGFPFVGEGSALFIAGGIG
ncbi:MAG: FAD-binding oxidoreductase, partial [Mycobacteriaceae bacterium]